MTAFAFEWRDVASLLSAAGLAATGLLALRASRRGASRVAFAAFALLWALQITAANLLRASADAAVANATALATALLLFAVPPPLLAFALLHPHHETRLRNPLVPLALALPPAAALLLLAFAPTLLVESAVVSAADGRARIGWGPAFHYAGVPLFYAAFFAAALLLARTYLRAKSPVERGQAALAAAALLTFPAYAASFNGTARILEIALGAAAPTAGSSATLLLGTYAAGLAGILALLLHVRSRRSDPWSRLLLAGALVPAAFGAAEGAAYGAGIRGFETLAIWRFLLVGLVVYAMARYRLFDADLRAGALAPTAAYALSVAALSASALAISPPAATSAPAGLALLALALAGAAAASAPVPRLAARAAALLLPEARDGPDYAYRRRVEVYRAALEASHARGIQDEEARFLAALRRDLRIGEDEHRLLLNAVTAAPPNPHGPLPRAAGPPERFAARHELGRGTFARALLAWDGLLARDVVLKEPLADARIDPAAFLFEARANARIDHPNVVRVYEALPHRTPPALVLEYVPGGNLAERLRAGPVPAPEAHRILRGLLEGLHAIHAAGFVHRDLKPSNVLLTPEGDAKIADFGVAEAFALDRDLLATTPLLTPETRPTRPRNLVAPHDTTGTANVPDGNTPLVGTLAYMAPEQARGAPVDARADLYSIAALAHLLLTGRPHLDLPHRDPARASAIVAAGPPPPRVKDVNPPIAAFLRKALAPDPDDRYQTATGMAKALEAARRDGGGGTGGDERGA